jgi:hypothetical protein
VSDGEQPGTAEAAPASAPEATAQVESQTAQPGESSKVESEPSKTTANWDDPSNPWKQKYDGFVGNFKQLKDSHEQTQAQLRQLANEREQERQQQVWARQQAEIAAEEQRLSSIAEQGDGDAALEVVKGNLQQRKTAAQIQMAQQQALQQYQGQVYQTFQRQYFDADVRVAKRNGLSDEDISGVLQSSKNYDDFHDALIQRGIERKMGDVERVVQQKVDAALKAFRESDKATSRGTERNPDVSSGSVPSTLSSVDDVYTAFASDSITRDQYVAALKKFGRRP